MEIINDILKEIEENIERLYHRLNEEGNSISEYRQTQIDSKLDAYINCKQIIERLCKKKN